MNDDGSRQDAADQHAQLQREPELVARRAADRLRLRPAEKGNLDIYSMNADGSDVQQLADSPALEQCRPTRRTARQIVFSSDRSGKDTRRLFVMGTNGANRRG